MDISVGDLITRKSYEHQWERAFLLPAKVLHLDGDQTYFKKCIKAYQKLGIHVHGLHVKEDMASVIGELIEKISPDIVVITGHDSYSEKKGNQMS